MGRRSASTLLQAARFGIVGGLATALNGGFYWLATERRWLPPLSANTVGFLLAFSLSFLGHWRWTFASPSGPAHGRTSLVRFFITALSGFTLNSFATWLLTGPLALPPVSALPVIVLLTPILLFVASKHWAFASAEK